MNERGQAAQETPSNSPVEPAYHRWLGHAVVLNYSLGTAQLTEDAIFEPAAGPVEAREAVFLLEEAGSVGVLVRRLLGEEEGLGAPVFIPWTTIHAMFSLSEDEEGDEAPN
jgi:hypothetical protein